jgi:hypothetical protein
MIGKSRVALLKQVPSMRRPVSVKPFLSSFLFFAFPEFFIEKLHARIAWQRRSPARSTPSIPCFDPFLRRPVDVKTHFRFLLSVNLFPFSQAASVATLPSALLCERFSLRASWVFSIH